jgi:hypothetical protein
MTALPVTKRISWAKAQTNDDPRPKSEVVSESVLHTSTLPVIVPPSSEVRIDRRGSTT